MYPPGGRSARKFTHSSSVPTSVGGQTGHSGPELELELVRDFRRRPYRPERPAARFANPWVKLGCAPVKRQHERGLSNRSPSALPRRWAKKWDNPRNAPPPHSQRRIGVLLIALIFALGTFITASPSKRARNATAKLTAR